MVIVSALLQRQMEITQQDENSISVKAAEGRRAKIAIPMVLKSVPTNLFYLVYLKSAHSLSPTILRQLSYNLFQKQLASYQRK